MVSGWNPAPELARIVPARSMLIRSVSGFPPPCGKASGPGDMDLGCFSRSGRSTISTDGDCKLRW